MELTVRNGTQMEYRCRWGALGTNIDFISLGTAHSSCWFLVFDTYLFSGAFCRLDWMPTYVAFCIRMIFTAHLHQYLIFTAHIHQYLNYVRRAFVLPSVDVSFLFK